MENETSENKKLQIIDYLAKHLFTIKMQRTTVNKNIKKMGLKMFLKNN